MKQISDSDYRTLIRLVPLLSKLMMTDDLRTVNLVRRSLLILKKWRRNEAKRK